MHRLLQTLNSLLFLAIAVAAVPANAAAQSAASGHNNGALAAAKELMSAMGVDKQMEVLMPQMLQSFTDVVGLQSGGKTEEVQAALEFAFSKVLSKKAELIDEMAVVYAGRLAVSDMEAIAAFYRSGVGRRFVATEPAILKELDEAAQAWGVRMAPGLEREFREELQRRGFKR